MGNYDDVAQREKDRQEKGRGKVDFKFVVYGEEKRCPTCWSLVNQREGPDGKTTEYCFNCASAQSR